MQVRLINTTLSTAAVLLMMAGCADSEAGTPLAGGTTATTGTTSSTTPSGEPSTPASSDRYGAPPVNNPLDATKFLTQPCAALTPQQVQGFNLSAQGKPDTDSAIAKHTGPSCKWGSSDTGEGIDVHFVAGNKNGLADVYRAHGEGKWTGYWEVTSVDGYPGVFAFTTDGRPSGSCNLFVGISETLAFAINSQVQLKANACDLAKQVAAAVVETLKRGG
jgi:hypothetical protein